MCITKIYILYKRISIATSFNYIFTSRMFTLRTTELYTLDIFQEIEMREISKIYPLEEKYNRNLNSYDIFTKCYAVTHT